MTYQKTSTFRVDFKYTKKIQIWPRFDLEMTFRRSKNRKIQSRFSRLSLAYSDNLVN